jgi:transketolase
MLAARFNRPGHEIVDHHTYFICSDGDLQEGISHEAASLAGHHGLGRLTKVYDDNHITNDGITELALSDDAPGRFRAYGWHVVELGEVANDLDALEAGLREGMAESSRPSLIVLRSHIGWPSPKFTDSPKAHGSPLGEDEVKVVKGLLDLPPDEHFFVPDDVLAYYREAGTRGAPLVASWRERLQVVREREPGLADDYDACIAGKGKTGWEAKIPSWPAGDGPATREACKEVLDAIVDVVPGLVGGGADLTGNTGTAVPDAGVVEPGALGGRQI